MFATLCLYEEEVDTFDKYLSSFVNIELTGLKHVIENLPHDLWYTETLSRLKEIERICQQDNNQFSHQRLIRSEIFGIMNLIDRQLKHLERN